MLAVLDTRGRVCAWSAVVVAGSVAVVASIGGSGGYWRLPPMSAPPALQAFASATVGAPEPSVFGPTHPRTHPPNHPSAGRRVATDTVGGGLDTSFATSAVRVRAASGTLAMTLLSPGGATPAPAVAPTVERNVVTYARGALDESYRNGPLGLEQVVTVRRPLAERGGPLTVSWRLTGSLTPLAVGRSAVLFLPRRGAGLIYAGLAARDASGRALPASIALRAGVLSLAVDDSRARYPVEIDPLLQQGSKLGARGESAGGKLGTSLALSADGNTALVGTPADDNFSGSARVFVRRGAAWFQEGTKLTVGPQDPNAQLGTAVALSADGNTALIGGPLDNLEVGAAWVFTRSGGAWSQQGAKLTASDEVGMGRFGDGLALSSDGNEALIGAPFDGDHVGAAWIFRRSAGAWSQQGARLTAVGERGGGDFGYAVALSADGGTALIGGPADSSQRGAAWVFTRAGPGLNQSASLTEPGEIGAGGFGTSVALSADGATAVIGSPSDNHARGTAWTFARSGAGPWRAAPRALTGSGEAGAGFFGWSVALSGDGARALVGAPVDASTIGAAWAFSRTGSSWAPDGGKLTGGGEVRRGGLGSALALSRDGTTALLGGPGDNHDLGATWVFVDAPRVALLGRLGFASRAGDAGMLLGCFGARPCSGTVTVSQGATVIGRLASYAIAADRAAIVRVPLRPAARRLSARQQLRVTVTVVNVDGTGTSGPLGLIPLRMPRGGPARAELLSGQGAASPGGDAGVLVVCPGTRSCPGTLAISRAGRTVGRRPRLFLPAGTGQIVHVQLSAATRRALDHDHAVTVVVSIDGGPGRTVKLQELP